MPGVTDRLIESTQLITVDPGDAGQRLDQFLARRFPDRSRADFQRLIADRHVRVNGQIPRKRHVLAAGDRVALCRPQPRTPALVAEQVALPILHQDADILVIDKPPGMAVHPGAGITDGTLVNALLGHDYERFAAMLDADLRPGIVHRLDKDTSGAMVVARTDTAKAALGDAFAARCVGKCYLALTAASPDWDRRTVRTRIGRNPNNRLKMAVIAQGGREAVTEFLVLARVRQGCLIAARLLTGRTHQIRVHLAHERCPILGDRLYGRTAAATAAPRQMLHAWQLTLPHPRTGARMRFVAPPPADFRETATAIAIDLETAIGLVPQDIVDGVPA